MLGPQDQRRSTSHCNTRAIEDDGFPLFSSHVKKKETFGLVSVIGSRTRKSKNGPCLLPCDSPCIKLSESAVHNSETNCNSNSNPNAGNSGAGGAGYFLWPVSTRSSDSAEERAIYFAVLQKELDSEDVSRSPVRHQATTMLELMTVRAFHSKLLRRYSLGTAIGFRMRKGVPTDVPAILVFVTRKIHKQWLMECQLLPSHLEGPGGVWCDVDVVEFSYDSSSVPTPMEQVYTELVEGLRGNDQRIGPGSQVSSQEAFGTLGTIVRSRTGSHQVGFLTNRHVAVDLDYPNQKMFHPVAPNLGPGVYLGAVERATSFITDELWYGIFASTNPETFVRADGAFVPFADSFDLRKVRTTVKGVGDMGEILRIDLQTPIGSLVGKPVVKVGRSTGLTKGTIFAYALEYNDDKGICFFTDILVVGENRKTFDLEGDSGSLILICDEHGGKPRPVGIIWGGTANRGRLKLKDGFGPENWTSAVDLGRLLDLLQLDLVATDERLQGTVGEGRHCATNVTTDPAMEKPSSPRERLTLANSRSGSSKVDGCQTVHFDDMSNFGSRSPMVQNGVADTDTAFRQWDFVTRLGEDPLTSVEHQFMQDFHVSLGRPSQNRSHSAGNLSGLRDGKDDSNDEISIGLQLGDQATKRQRT